jgi:aryl-alcohol dehydrogenase-like predicted oxidoreductase
VKRDIEATLLPICAEHGVATLSYSSLALGLLTGRIGPDRTFEGDDLRKDNPLFSIRNREKVAAFAKDVVPVASDHEATTAQIVIAWTLQQPGITFALCGARNPDQAIENAKAGQIRLSAEDLGQIDSAARRHLVELDR